MSDAGVNIHALDAAYKPFPTFAEWAAKTSVDTVRWDRYKAELQNRPATSPDAFKRAYEIVKRAAALDTGAIEGLYEVDRGFTFTVALETAAWELELAKKGENVRSLFEAQLHAYDYVLDFATKTVAISEAAIRKLHEVVCAAQPTYRVLTQFGFQEHSLPKGKYKVNPNHPYTGDGKFHSYAPVDVTPIEMARLLNEIRSEAFQKAHPVMQAAYAHYGFVVIHPFADGNGRVARALASIFTYRAISMPIMILSEQKERYLDALEAADRGDYQAFTEFILKSALDTMTVVRDSFQSALAPSREESLAAINGPYVRKGSYGDQQVDEGGTRLMKALEVAMQNEVSKVAGQKIQGKAGLAAGTHSTYLQHYRPSHNVGQHLFVELMSIQPSQAQYASLPPAVVSRNYDLFVPIDARGQDEYIARDREERDDFSAAVDDVLVPVFAGPLQLRIEIFTKRVVDELLAELTIEIDRANQRLR
jgi:Fic family protein